MKKVMTIIALVVAIATSANAQLLYKITGNGLQRPSYIVGTYHLAPVAFADSIPGLQEALQSSAQVYGELDMADMMSPDNMQRMQSAMMLPEGSTIQSLLSEDELARLNAFMVGLLGVDFSNPMVAQQMERLTPQALNTQFSLLMFMKKKGGFDPTNTFDGYFQQYAQQHGKAVGGLETVDFQVRTLFQGVSLPRQKQLLMCLVDNKDYHEAESERIIDAFFTQDLEAIAAVLDEKIGNDCDSSPDEEDALIYNRNADWATRMPAIMAAQPTFFAVGAAHLPGDRGVLSLLRKAGYTVEGVR